MVVAKLVHEVADQVGIAALVVLLYSEAFRLCRGAGCPRNLLLAAIFGSGVILTMLEPVHVGPGIQVDGRHVLIGLGSFLLGPAGAAVTLGAGVAMRLDAAGAGTVAGLLGMAITATVGLSWRVRLSRRDDPLRFRDVLLLGVMTNACLLSVVVLPPQAVMQVLVEGAPVVVLSNLAGCLLVGSMLARESRRIGAEERERLASRTDVLTSLANRRGFEEWLARFGRSAGSASPVALLMIDVDHFKGINDTFGHARGDDVLREIAAAIRAQVRSGDTAARVGGDEFVVVLEGASPDSAKDVGERICADVRRRFAGGDVVVSISVGIAWPQATTSNPAAFVAAADHAMYLAKLAGRGRVSVAPEPSPA